MHPLMQMGVLKLLGALFGNECMQVVCAGEGTEAVKCLLQEGGCA